MKLQTLAAACGALVCLSATAALAEDPITVTLAQPVAQPVKFIAGGAIFNCRGDACIANAPTSQTYGVDTCKKVAAKVGAVTAFAGRRSLDGTRLSRCNVAAAPAETTIARK
ncbi:MAG: hypothetical protein KGO51_16025 [Alphaproteobacteria bacterium]|nr:hypothetical protein [Alphaproteobacteria bacterium]